MQALHDVVQKGWVRYIGMSSCHAYQCEYFDVFLLYVHAYIDFHIGSPCNAE